MPIIDRAQLMDHLDGDLEFLQDAHELFNEESRTMLDDLRAAIAASDLAAVQSLTHTLRGMLANFMAEPACETADQLRAAGIGDASNALLDKLNNQMDSMSSEIKEILLSGNP